MKREYMTLDEMLAYKGIELDSKEGISIKNRLNAFKRIDLNTFEYFYSEIIGEKPKLPAKTYEPQSFKHSNPTTLRQKKKKPEQPNNFDSNYLSYERALKYILNKGCKQECDIILANVDSIEQDNNFFYKISDINYQIKFFK
jgi:hypothetical protein